MLEPELVEELSVKHSSPAKQPVITTTTDARPTPVQEKPDSTIATVDDSLVCIHELNPFEQNARRKYIHIAMVLPCGVEVDCDGPLGTDVKGCEEWQMANVRRCVEGAFFKALQTWPVFGGYICKAERDSERLVVRFSKTTDWEERLDAQDRFQGPAQESGVYESGDESEDEIEVHRAFGGWFGDKYFLLGENHQLEEAGMPPVMLKLSFAGPTVILGFSFFQVLFDDESIQRFMSQFSHMTFPDLARIYKSVIVPEAMNQPWLRREESVANHPLAKAAEGGGDDRGSYPAKDARQRMEKDSVHFHFYDWSSKEIEQRKPPGELYTKVIFVKHAVVSGVLAELRRLSTKLNLGGAISPQDCLAAILWVAIMRARLHKGRVSEADTSQVNITFSAGRRLRWPRRYDETYFGNSTVTVAARCPVKSLLFGTGNDQPRPPLTVDFEGLARAAGQIGSSQRSICNDYLNKLSEIKRRTPAGEDWAAEDRALDRASSGLTLEDWTWFEAASKPTDIPYTLHTQPRFCPAENQAEAGKIVLLPRAGGNMGAEEWTVWVCLSEDEMALMLDDLAYEGWWERES